VKDAEDETTGTCLLIGSRMNGKIIEIYVVNSKSFSKNKLKIN
jgi:IMP cyclohydrolase